MNTAGLGEIRDKHLRVMDFLEQRGWDGLLIGRKDNFSWFTCGGTNEVIVPSETGFGLLLITREGIRLIAQVMDGPRIIDEELRGLEVQYEPLYWYGPSREQKAAELIRGLRVLSDVPVEGAQYEARAIQNLHYPLTDAEIARLRLLGAATDRIIRRVADEVEPGTKEADVAGMFLGEYGRAGIQCDVLLVGSDERISRYRHPNPSEKTVGRYLLLHPAVRKWGLHANVTRLVHFGPVPEDLRRRHEAACRVAAAAVTLCTPGRTFQEILAVQKQLYAQSGFADEWKYHFQGGITGYIVADPTLALDPEAVIVPNQAYDWFITITGVKVEELSINTGGRQEVCSMAGNWPAASYEYRGKSVELPQILVR